MLAGISITCFFSSYLVAMLLEISRIFFRNRVGSFVELAFAFAGVFAHTLFLAYRAGVTGGSPLSSPFDWYLLAAWTMAVVYLLVAISSRGTASGVFILPLVLLLIGMAQFATKESFAPQRASRAWGDVHGTALLLGTVSVLVGFAAGAMYLVQSYRLKHKLLPSEGLRLPSLERLEKLNSRALLVSVVLIGIGFGAGLMLNAVKNRRDDAAIPFSDPVVVMSALMFFWLLIASVFNLAYRPARRGRKVAYLTLASFVFLAFTLAAVLFGGSEHNPSRGAVQPAPGATAPGATAPGATGVSPVPGATGVSPVRSLARTLFGQSVATVPHGQARYQTPRVHVEPRRNRSLCFKQASGKESTGQWPVAPGVGVQALAWFAAARRLEGWTPTAIPLHHSPLGASS